MTVDSFREEFERLGEAAVEDLFVRHGSDQMKRVYALRWLEEKGRARLAAAAIGSKQAHEEKAKQLRTLELAALIFVVAFGVAGVGLYLLHTGVPH